MILSSFSSFVIFFCSPYDYPVAPIECVIDRCDNEVCVIETPEGWVEVKKKSDYREGKEVTCPMWLIEPT